MIKKIENRSLTYMEKMKFDELERRVIWCYEMETKRKFMLYDIKILKRLVRAATPEQINSQIRRFAKDWRYSKNFTFFGYIEPPVMNQFKNKRGGKSNDI